MCGAVTVCEFAHQWAGRLRAGCAVLAAGKPFDAMNSIAATLLLHLTSSARFEGDLNVDLNDITMNMVPFPRQHFLLSSMSPLVVPRDQAKLAATRWAAPTDVGGTASRCGMCVQRCTALHSSTWRDLAGRWGTAVSHQTANFTARHHQQPGITNRCRTCSPTACCIMHSGTITPLMAFLTDSHTTQHMPAP
jgi:hypothetical protein